MIQPRRQDVIDIVNGMDAEMMQATYWFIVEYFQQEEINIGRGVQMALDLKMTNPHMSLNLLVRLLDHIKDAKRNYEVVVSEKQRPIVNS